MKEHTVLISDEQEKQLEKVQTKLQLQTVADVIVVAVELLTNMNILAKTHPELIDSIIETLYK